jgi:nicotinate-nucleotide--dimethylbenzimidazole phosphoribosyltransferase
MEKLQTVLKRITEVDKSLIEKTQKRLDNLTKPLGSLGKLEEMAKLMVAITEKENPSVRNKVVFTMAGDHGVVEEGVSAYPSEVTPQMVYNFLQGGAGINVLSRFVGARVVIVDMGVAKDLESHPELLIKKVNYGTKNMVKEPAMTREEAIKSIEIGIEIVENELKKGIDIMGTGDMGIGNTTPSSAIVAVITKVPVEKVTGRGTGIDDAGLTKKIEVIKKAIKVNKPDPKDAIDVLSKVGGFEIGGLVGVIIAGAANKLPVVIDGFISGAAALIAYTLEPKVRNYLIASHCSVETGHKVIFKHIELQPLLNLDLRLGEGTGAVLGMNIVEAGIRIMTEMATFESADVSTATK